jgi:hypothetical protein
MGMVEEEKRWKEEAQKASADLTTKVSQGRAVPKPWKPRQSPYTGRRINCGQAPTVSLLFSVPLPSFGVIVFYLFFF